jgi:3-oxoacyl-[acyl-carrier-protein] synthase III
MVNELYHSGRLKKGEKILLLVPESGRFSYMYALLTVC